MLNDADIEKTLRLGEDSITEFKSVVRNDYKIDAGDISKAVASFANAGGGHILVGVEDDGTPTGVGTLQQADALMRQISSLCQDRIRPSISCQVVKAECGKELLLIVQVPAFGPDRPYLVDGRCFVRDAAQSRPATRDELVRMAQSVDHHFDEQPIENATRDALDEKSIRDILTTTNDELPSDEGLDLYLQALGALDPDGRPTVSGILFFGKDPLRWLLDARVSAVRFKGTNISGEFLDKHEIGGRLPDQLQSATDFLNRHMVNPASIQGLERVEKGVPLEVLREALVNALVHRDYRASSQTCVFVFDDRVEIVNPGVLLNRLSLESICRAGIKQYRNPLIVSLMSRMRRRESLGMGIPEMIRRMKANGLPEPGFSLEGGHFRVVLRLQPAREP